MIDCKNCRWWHKHSGYKSDSPLIRGLSKEGTGQCKMFRQNHDQGNVYVCVFPTLWSLQSYPCVYTTADFGCKLGRPPEKERQLVSRAQADGGDYEVGV